MSRIPFSNVLDELYNGVMYVLIVGGNIVLGAFISLIALAVAWVIIQVGSFLQLKDQIIYQVLDNGSIPVVLAIFLIYSVFSILGIFKFIKNSEVIMNNTKPVGKELLAQQEN